FSTAALVLEARSGVHDRAEIVEYAAGGDGNARSAVQTELQYDACVASPPIEVFDFILDGQRSADGVGRIVKRGHDCVTYGLDDETVMTLHPRGQECKMVAYQTVGGGVAKIVIESCRSLKVGEHDRDAADLNFVARAQQLFGT